MYEDAVKTGLTWTTHSRISKIAVNKSFCWVSCDDLFFPLRKWLAMPHGPKRQDRDQQLLLLEEIRTPVCLLYLDERRLFISVLLVMAFPPWELSKWSVTYSRDPRSWLKKNKYRYIKSLFRNHSFITRNLQCRIVTTIINKKLMVICGVFNFCSIQ